MSGHQLGMILVIKWFKNWHYEKNVFNKKRSPKLMFTNEKKKEEFCQFLTLKIELWFIDRFFFFPLSMLILSQKSCFLGPTIFEILQPKRY